ncbi:MAG: RCC1 domain-containing protein, partial [Polyangiales bacterium]
CAIDEDDDLICWGHVGLDVETTPVLVASDVADVAIFNFAFCWVELSGEAKCLGRELQADFGDGITGDGGATSPRGSALLDGFHAMDGGYRGGCGLDATGELRCWGYSIYGTVLRESLVEEVPAPVVDEDGAAVMALSNVAMGTEGTCAVSEGNAYCWGAGGRTDFGNDSNRSYAYPFQIPGLSAVTDVARSDFGGACAIGTSSSGSGLHCWSTNPRGRLGDVGESTRIPVLVPGVPSATSVDMAAAHTCAIVAGDEVMCWGANDSGQMGQLAVAGTSEPPTYVELDGVRIQASQISLGGAFACAILSGGEEGQVVCWGGGARGQLGHAMSPASSLPVRTMVTDATSIEAGSEHICAIAGTPARVLCWGAGSAGQRGDGSMSDSSIPTEVEASGPIPLSVAAGYVSSCAAYDDDSVRCWGDNTFSQLGVAGPGSPVPQVVPGVSAQSVAAGSNQDFANCAGSEGGSWQCWGLNDHGKLGTSPDIHFTPQEVTR